MNPLIKLVASTLLGDKKYILFVGAGLSKDAGVPTAWDLMLKVAGILYAAENKETDQVNISKEKLEEWFIQSEFSKQSYSELIGGIYSTPHELQEYHRASLNVLSESGKAHEGIVELVKRNIIRAIISTNFDNYIEQALDKEGIKYQVISWGENPNDSEDWVHCSDIRIYKPHGTLEKGQLKVTPEDLTSLSSEWETELLDIINKHGVIMLGYSGQDKSIQEIFKKRNHGRYKSFYVNPTEPDESLKEIFKDFEYIKCKGASSFIYEDFIGFIEKLNKMSNQISSSPSIYELEDAFKNGNVPIIPLYKKFLNKIYNKLESIRPDFDDDFKGDSSFASTLLLKQIDLGIEITEEFIKACLLASEYNNYDVIKTIYDYFGTLLIFYNRPENRFGAWYPSLELCGYQFLIYEMFVAFISSLMKYDRYECIGKILPSHILAEYRLERKYEDHTFISRYEKTFLNELDSRGLYKRRFESENISKMLTFKEFIEADYFLFMRSILRTENEIKYIEPETYSNPYYDFNSDITWFPECSIYFNQQNSSFSIPLFIKKPEKIDYLDKILKATNVSTRDAFKKLLKERCGIFSHLSKTCFRSEYPLTHYDFEKLGSLK